MESGTWPGRDAPPDDGIVAGVKPADIALFRIPGRPAMTGDGALEYIEQEEQLLRRTGELLRAAPKELPEKVERLVEQRAMSEADARARVRNQPSREARLAMADRVIDNSGYMAALEQQVDDVWEWMHTLAPFGTEPSAPWTEP